jgi:hypothetical protein
VPSSYVALGPSRHDINNACACICSMAQEKEIASCVFIHVMLNVLHASAPPGYYMSPDKI